MVDIFWVYVFMLISFVIVMSWMILESINCELYSMSSNELREAILYCEERGKEFSHFERRYGTCMWVCG